jgi:hypothetical protein
MGSFVKGTSLRGALLVSASVMSLAVASTEVWAADMPTKATYKAAPIEPLPVWTWYLEGGGFNTSGGTLFGSDETKARPGWEGAIGLDYRIAGSPWHVSAQFRYGKSVERNSPTSGYFTGAGIGTAFVVGNLNHKESHAVADFAVGHDIGIGTGQAQLKFGVRVVDLSAKSTATGTIITAVPSGICNTVPGCAGGVISFESRFVGAGPRGSIEGSQPIMGPLAVEYMGGVAYLYGTRSFNVTASAPGLGSTAFGTSDVTGIFNADASLGLSYAFSKAAKVTLGYRYDGYWGAMKMLDSNLNMVNNDRAYYGPFLRFTGAF